MFMASSAPVHPSTLNIPIDLFVKTKYWSLTLGDLSFTDSSGNLVFKVEGQSFKSGALPPNKRILVDAAGVPLFSMYRHHNGSWEAFKGDDSVDKELVFRVERKLKSLTSTELNVILVSENRGDINPSFEIKGCPFQRACTIYKGDSIVGQTSLMYKLGKAFVGRCKFRLTIFPGFDHALAVALVVIFFDGRK